MGRRIPDDNASLSSLILHPVIYLWLVGAGVAASMAIVTSLCSVLFWKKTDPSLSSSDDPSESKPDLEDSELGGNKEDTLTSPPNNAEVEDTKELPLPPAMMQPKEPHVPINIKRAASERKLAFNLSIKAINNLPRTLSVARLRDHQQAKKPKPEDSVWMKTIILGEKCQVNRDQEEDSAVIFEDKGKTVTAYHPRTKSSMSSSQFTYNAPGPDDDHDHDHDQQPSKSNDHDQQPLPPPPQNQ